MKGLLHYFNGPAGTVKYRDKETPTGFPLIEGLNKFIYNGPKGELGPPEVVLEFKAKKFDISKPEELQEYQSICDMIVNGRCGKVDRQTLFTEDGSTMIIYLEWVTPHDAGPAKRRKGLI